MRCSRLAVAMIQLTGVSTPEPLVEVSNSRLEELLDEGPTFVVSSEVSVFTVWPAEVVVGILLKIIGGSVVRVGEVVSELLQTPGLFTPHEFHKL